MYRKVLVGVLALLVLPLSLLIGKTTAAQIAGTISDPSGAPVPDAAVSIVNRDTQVKREPTSNASGNFAIPLLMPGTYSLIVEKSGFRVIRQPEFTLQVAQDARMDFQLRVGDVLQM